MSTRHLIGGAVAIGALGAIGIGAAIAATGDSAVSAPVDFEVVEDAARFAFDDTPVFDDGMPAYGNQFVTQGFIYEPGTLALGGGVLADGTPTHPDRVLGTWICEGVMVGDGARTERGPWVVSTQVYDFGELDGDDVVVTHGIETPEIGLATARAVVGGTGEHVGAAGTQHQTLEGFSDSGGVELSVTMTPIED